MFKKILFVCISVLFTQSYAVEYNLEDQQTTSSYSNFVRIGIAEYYPSINGQTDKTTPLIDAVIKSFNQSHLNVILSHYDNQWGHVLNDLRSGKIDASLWWFKTAAREKEFLFSDKPVVTIQTYMIGLKSNSKLRTLSSQVTPTAKELSPFSLGMVTNFYEPSITDPMQKVQVQNEQELFSGLQKGQYDLIFSNQDTALKYINLSDLMLIPVEKKSGYMMFSKNSERDRDGMLQQIFDYNFKMPS